MEVQQLIHMANRIGEFFQAFPEHAEAVHGVAEHIQKFWTPDMRRVLVASLDEELAQQLSPLVREALQTLAAPATKQV